MRHIPEWFFRSGEITYGGYCAAVLLAFFAGAVASRWLLL
jgi:uncharacterized protein YegJ (DUF2314 family)